MRNYWTRAFVPKTGTDLQPILRHYPVPAEAATDIGADDDRPAGSARGLALTLIALAVALASVVIHFWPQIVAFFLEIL
jgi:hypothetical protein